MKRIHIVAEGPTEEKFIKTVLASYLSQKDIYPNPVILKTKRIEGGPQFKGGVSSYSKIKRDIERLLYDKSAAAVTTMIDFYRVPSDFPGKKTLQAKSCYERVAYLEAAFAKNINHNKFLPYLALHEFEALIFTSPSRIAARFPGTAVEQDLIKIRQQFDSPEEINEGPNTAPSKRLIGLLPEYQKPRHGPLIAADIGIESMRQECLHFNEWLTKLEAIGKTRDV